MKLSLVSLLSQRRLLTSICLVFTVLGSGPSHAEDPLFASDLPPTRLVSHPANWLDTSFSTETVFPPAPEVVRSVEWDRSSLWQRIQLDHQNYYDLETFRFLTGGFFLGAAVANTQLDDQLHRHFQTSVRGATSDDWSEFLHADKELGNGLYSLPVFATAWAAGEYFEDSPMLVTTGRWGERSMRSFLVGAPPLILAQRLTGGSRPGELDRGSRWLPFQDNNGVSGHAFMSALPFINAAKMTDRPLLKASFYAGSFLGPLSRVNDDAHYPSQVALGWWMAYAAAAAIDRTELSDRNTQILPYMSESGGVGGMLEFRY
ncbi:putative signal peptide and transmembrane protein [Rhodopirellula islandica]|uniref:Signal peptide and transmembrane protein n=1 Tax=Rhodopirellula islandica TaxID=595434 RepID=A0A0J1BMR4_RHOIS|nr:phosphatase PAP2 family protein [Rhodopirellula islandica]KLU07782.1 putative signal peptide and transmembrane protein [Rhodopirellula islandica]